jgi:NAD(P)-dependent dehydrogenase (short-subunit alcohol dehydrogenase family)
VVTGANRGIGREIARQLAQRPGFTVVLTARDERKGKAAARDLGTGFHPLDVDSERSIAGLAEFLGKNYGRCDVLVNNAGILADPRGSRILDSKVETHRATLETNVLGPLMLAQALVPLMRKHRYGRIVNVSSAMGQLSDMGTGSPAYRMSKAALNALTLMLAADLCGSGILVNSMSPGWVRTDMGGSSAPRSVAEGADTAVWLATLPDNGPSGGFFKDRKPIAW